MHGDIHFITEYKEKIVHVWIVLLIRFESALDEYQNSAYCTEMINNKRVIFGTCVLKNITQAFPLYTYR
jgi:hypothetical protein